MSTNLPIKMLWSVWDNNSKVSWEYKSRLVTVKFNMPPVAVAILPINGLIGVIGSFDEFGAENFQTYDYEGNLKKSYAAPDLGSQSQFGGAREITDGQIEAMVGFYNDNGWKDQAGTLDLDTGLLDGIHRSY